MHYALVFTTSKAKTSDQTALAWLRDFTNSFAFLNPENNASWLAPGVAAEIICAPTDTQNYPDMMRSPAFQALRHQADKAAIDVNVVPIKNRRKAILMADMDSTIITSESLDELAIAAGIGEQIIGITRRAMAGEIDFEAALDERVAMLAGKPKLLIDKMVADSRLTAGARTLVQTMRAHGAFCYLVSGGFEALTGSIAATCGFHNHHANHLEHDDKTITGTVQKPVLDHYAKVTYLQHYCAVHDVDMADTACIGDGANDLDMLGNAGFGVAFAGKPILREKVALQLNHTDLTGLLFLQGYRRDQFITDH